MIPTRLRQIFAKERRPLRASGPLTLGLGWSMRKRNSAPAVAWSYLPVTWLSRRYIRPPLARLRPSRAWTRAMSWIRFSPPWLTLPVSAAGRVAASLGAVMIGGLLGVRGCKNRMLFPFCSKVGSQPQPVKTPSSGRRIFFSERGSPRGTRTPEPKTALRRKRRCKPSKIHRKTRNKGDCPLFIPIPSRWRGGGYFIWARTYFR